MRKSALLAGSALLLGALVLSSAIGGCSGKEPSHSQKPADSTVGSCQCGYSVDANDNPNGPPCSKDCNSLCVEPIWLNKCQGGNGCNRIRQWAPCGVNLDDPQYRDDPSCSGKSPTCGTPVNGATCGDCQCTYTRDDTCKATSAGALSGTYLTNNVNCGGDPSNNSCCQCTATLSGNWDSNYYQVTTCPDCTNNIDQCNPIPADANRPIGACDYPMTMYVPAVWYKDCWSTCADSLGVTVLPNLLRRGADTISGESKKSLIKQFWAE